MQSSLRGVKIAAIRMQRRARHENKAEEKSLGQVLSFWPVVYQCLGP